MDFTPSGRREISDSSAKLPTCGGSPAAAREPRGPAGEGPGAVRPHRAARADAGVRSPPLQAINCPAPSPSPSPALWPPSPSELARWVLPSCRLPGPHPWPCRLPLLWACRVPRGLGLAGLRESRQAGSLPTEAPRVPHVGSREPASRPGRSFPPARLMPGAPRARATPGRPPSPPTRGRPPHLQAPPVE